MKTELTTEQIEKIRHCDLGAGFSKRGDACRIDISPATEPDILMDIGWDKLPFADSQMDIIDCHHTIEHLDGFERIFMMNEAYRVLKPGGLMFITCPHGMNEKALVDPTHKFPPLVGESFAYFSTIENYRLLQEAYGIKARFEILEYNEKLDGWQISVTLRKPA